MADDKNFKELVKEIQDLNKSITKQNVERADSLNDLVNAQNKTTDMVTRRLTKAQTAQLDKDNEQMRVAKEESDRQAAADKKAQELENKKFTMKKFKDRVSNKLQKAPSALLGAARMATYNNRVMRNVAKGLKGISSGLGITGFAKAGLKTVWGTIKKLIQGGLLIGGIILLDKFFNSDVWPKVIDFMEKKLIPGLIAFGKWVYTEFGPGIKTALFGEGGTFEKPTGGLYGGVISFFKILGEIGENMKDDDTAGKLAKTIKSFVRLIFSLFGMGREELVTASYGGDKKTIVKEGYFENILDAAKTFKDDFVALFESVINTVGQAFAEAHPIIARIFGIDNAEEYAKKQIAKENVKISGDIEKISRFKGEGAVQKYVSMLTAEEQVYASKYAQAIDKYEKSKSVLDKNSSNNAIIAAILGQKNMTEAQKFAAGAQRTFTTIMSLFNIGRQGEENFDLNSGVVDTFKQALEESLKKEGIYSEENMVKILRTMTGNPYNQKDTEGFDLLKQNPAILKNLNAISEEIERKRKLEVGEIGALDGSTGADKQNTYPVVIDASKSIVNEGSTTLMGGVAMSVDMHLLQNSIVHGN